MFFGLGHRSAIERTSPESGVTLATSCRVGRRTLTVPQSKLGPIVAYRPTTVVLLHLSLLTYNLRPHGRRSERRLARCAGDVTTAAAAAVQ